jgi:hypothetical protein
MRIIVIVSLIMLLGVSCEKDCGCDPPPFSNSCLGDAFERFKDTDEAKAIVEFKLDGQPVYMLDDESYTFDGRVPLLNTSCDTVCWFGGFFPPPCESQLERVGDIWRK